MDSESSPSLRVPIKPAQGFMRYLFEWLPAFHDVRQQRLQEILSRWNISCQTFAQNRTSSLSGCRGSSSLVWGDSDVGPFNNEPTGLCSCLSVLPGPARDGGLSRWIWSPSCPGPLWTLWRTTSVIQFSTSRCNKLSIASPPSYGILCLRFFFKLQYISFKQQQQQKNDIKTNKKAHQLKMSRKKKTILYLPIKKI